MRTTILGIGGLWKSKCEAGVGWESNRIRSRAAGLAVNYFWDSLERRGSLAREILHRNNLIEGRVLESKGRNNRSMLAAVG